MMKKTNSYPCTREELGMVLSATMSTKTIKSEFLKGTIYEEMELTDKWFVSFMEVNKQGVLVIECLPPEYIKD
jgi:hypothetical protein